jgi:hypothetical protein
MGRFAASLDKLERNYLVTNKILAIHHSNMFPQFLYILNRSFGRQLELEIATSV